MTLNTYSASGNQLSTQARNFYSMDLIERLLPKLPLFQFGQKRTIPKRTGGFGSGEIQFRKWTALATNTTPMTEGAVPSPKTLANTVVTTNLQQLGDWIKMSDVLVDAAIDDVMSEATRLLGESAGQSLHLLLQSVLEAATTNSTWPVGGSAVTDITATDVLNSATIKRAARNLEIRRVPKINGAYCMYIHPSQKYDLMNDPQWRNISEYNGGKGDGGNSMIDAELGQIHGVRFVVSDLATRATSNANYVKSFMFGEEPWGQFDFATMAWSNPNPDTNLGIRIHAEPPGKMSQSDPFGQWGFVAYKLAYAFKILDTDRIEQVWTSYSS
jgi:N4-gp56 family major capsid protein